MLRYTKSLPYLPDLARPRPFVTEQDKGRAAAEPPLPVPFHCKPWVDGQTIGWTLFYGYRTAVKLRRSVEGQVVVENGEELDEERGRPDTITLTEEGVRLATGYSLWSPAGLVTLIIPANRPVAGLRLAIGCLETEEQYRPVSLFFRFLPFWGQASEERDMAIAATRKADDGITLTAGVELARVVLVPRREALGAARPLEGEALLALREREAAYRAEEETTPTRWTAATGDSFTHLYRVWSRREAGERGV